MKQIIVCCLLWFTVFGLSSCYVDRTGNRNNGDITAKIKIGVSMPTKDLQCWEIAGSNMKSSLEAHGYDIQLEYAGNNVEQQLEQVKNMIADNCNVLVIAPIDGGAFNEVLVNAKERNIYVIAYDKLIMNSDAVTYCATFDNEKIGEMQGQFIVDRLDIKNQADFFNIEFFAGPVHDNNAISFFNGAMKILRPYINSGKLTIASGQDSFDVCAISNWSATLSKKRMDNILAANYSNGKKLHAVVASNDVLAHGVISSLQAAGYDKTNFPIVTGQDCEPDAIKNIIDDYQAMSVFKNTRMLVSTVVDMIKAIAEEQLPTTNGFYNNGTINVPSFLCKPENVNKCNYREILIDSGYYTMSQLK